jgi:hypothetical protein
MCKMVDDALFTGIHVTNVTQILDVLVWVIEGRREVGGGEIPGKREDFMYQSTTREEIIADMPRRFFLSAMRTKFSFH